MEKSFCVQQKKVLSFGGNQTVEVRANSLTEPNVWLVTTALGLLPLLIFYLKSISTRCEASKTIQSGYLIFLQLVAIVD